MTGPQRGAAPERLLAHTGWIRSLALELARDPELADDLVQETWARALEHAPDEPRSLGGWLAQVMRNTLRQWHRGAGRRVRRERSLASPEAVDEGSAAAERLELSRAVVDAVRALDEPYRTTIVLRHFEELPPRRIAARLGVPVATVKSRLNRAYKMLRGALDRQHGGVRRAWLPGLALAFRPRETGPAPLAVDGVARAVGLAALPVAAAAALLLGPDRDPAPPEPARSPGTAETSPVSGGPGASPERRAAHDPRAPASTATAYEGDAAHPIEIDGLVVDPRGVPVADVPVVLRAVSVPAWPGPEAALRRAAGRLDAARPDDARARSDDRGRFRFSVPYAAGTRDLHHLVFAGDARRAALVAAVVPPATRDATRTLVVAPRAVVTGAVLDPADRPIDGATVSIDASTAATRRRSPTIDHAVEVAPVATTGSDGRFRIEGPAVSGTTLRVRAAGHGAASLALGGVPREEVRVVLAPAAADDLLAGTVVDADGAPVEGARVAIDGTSTTTDASGAFRLPRGAAPRGAPLLAAAPGRSPARRAFDPDLPGGFAEPLVLRLGGPPPSIAGRLVDDAGRPIADALVYTAELTPIARGPGQVPICLEHVLSPGRPPPLAHARTDGDGRFALPGLADRTYTLRAVVGLSRSELGRHRAGAEDLLVRAGSGPGERVLEGFVRAPDGTPLAGVTLTPVLELLSVPRPWSDADLELRVPGRPVRSDEDGWFATEGGGGPLFLQVGGDGVLPGFVPVPDPLPADGLRVVAARSCRLVVEATPESRRFVRFEVLDASLAPVDVVAFRGAEVWPFVAVPLVDGSSEVVAVPETARWLRLVAADGSDRRIALAVTPERVTTVRPVRSP